MIDPVPGQNLPPLTGHRGVINGGLRKSPITTEPEGDRFVKEEVQPEKEWTILAYMCGSNDLKEEITGNFQELESSGTPGNSNVAVYLSRDNYKGVSGIGALLGGAPPRVGSDWKGSRVYRISPKNPDGTASEAVLLEDHHRESVNDPATLQRFIETGMKKFPAKHYAVIISSHGGGHLGTIVDRDKKSMPLDSMAKALEGAQSSTGKKIDVLGLDACNMGQAEVAYQLKDSADYLVASPGQTHDESYDFTRLMESLDYADRNGLEIDPKTLAWGMVEVSGNFGQDVPTLSAIDLGKMPLVREGIDGLATALMETDTPREVIRDVIFESPQHDTSVYKRAKKLEKKGIELEGSALYSAKDQDRVRMVDVVGFCRKLQGSRRVGDDNLKKAAGKLLSTLDETLINKQVYFGKADELGLSVFLPTSRLSGDRPDGEYLGLSMSRDGAWDNYLMSDR